MNNKKSRSWLLENLNEHSVKELTAYFTQKQNELEKMTKIVQPEEKKKHQKPNVS